VGSIEEILRIGRVEGSKVGEHNEASLTGGFDIGEEQDHDEEGEDEEETAQKELLLLCS